MKLTTNGSSEYVVYGINSLASTTGGPVRVLSHSQGGLNVQWALTFFPSTRVNTYAFTPLAPDYRGSTGLGELINAIVFNLTGKANAASLQQAATSNYVRALSTHGGLAAFAVTNNVYSTTDGVVEPETGPNASSVLSGPLATNIALQDICSTRTTNHITIVVDVLSMFFVLQSFSSSDGRAHPELITPAQKILLCANALPTFTDVGALLGFTSAEFDSVIRTGVTGTPGSMVSAEPPLMPYAQ
jgi:hypothetical protein